MPAPTNWQRFLPLLAVAALAILFLLNLQPPHSSDKSAHVPTPFPQAQLAAVIGDAPVSLPLPMGKIWVLNVFASWCASCIVEHPELMAWKEGAGKNVPLIGMTWRDKPEATRLWLEKMGNVYDQLGADEHGELAINLGLTGVPETYVIGPDGKVAGVLRGPLTAEKRTGWLEPLIKSLEENSGSQ